MSKGYYISFAGPVTFKNAKHVKEVAKFVPSDRFLIETDCPYLAPVPYRGKQNTPLLIEETYKYIAEVLNISVEELAGIVIKNTKKLFKLG